MPALRGEGVIQGEDEEVSFICFLFSIIFVVVCDGRDALASGPVSCSLVKFANDLTLEWFSLRLGDGQLQDDDEMTNEEVECYLRGLVTEREFWVVFEIETKGERQWLEDSNV